MLPEGVLNPNNCRVSDGLKKRAEEMVEPARPGIRKRDLLLRKGLVHTVRNRYFYSASCIQPSEVLSTISTRPILPLSVTSSSGFTVYSWKLSSLFLLDGCCSFLRALASI